MVLVDTSVWVEHLRTGKSGLESLLHEGDVACHVLIVGEPSSLFGHPSLGLAQSRQAERGQTDSQKSAGDMPELDPRHVTQRNRVLRTPVP